MAVLGRLLISSAERLDLPDLLSIDSYTAGDFQYLIQTFVGATTPYVIAGFDVINPAAAIGTSAVAINIANSAMYYPGSGAGSFYYGLPTGNPNAQPLVPVLVPNAVNYVYLTLTTANVAPDTRAFWDPDANGQVGDEFTEEVNTESVIETQINVSTSAFPNNSVPVAIIVMGPTVISSITDARPMMFRLGTGGQAPNPYNRFAWPALPDSSYERVEPAITITSGSGADPFQGADKNILTLKQWMDAIMSKLAELGGTTFWYQPSSGTAPSIASLFVDALETSIVTKGSFTHSSVTPGLLSWSEDVNYEITGDDREYVLRAGNVTIPNGDVAYIALNRNLPFNGGNQQVAWTNGANYINTIGGVIGLFANLSQGDWVKRPTDPNSFYIQVVAFYSGTNGTGSIVSPANAKSVVVNGTYAGPTINDIGIYDQGIYATSDSPADVIVAPRNSPAIAALGGNFSWVAYRDDTIEGIANVATTSLSITSIVSTEDTALVTTSAAHGLANGYYITISGTTNYNGTYQVEVESSTSFSVTIASSFPSESSGTARYAIVNTAATTIPGSNPPVQKESADHGFATDETIIIAGTTNYNGSFKIGVIDATHFQMGVGGAFATESTGTATLAKVFVRNQGGTLQVIQGVSVDPDGPYDNMKLFIGMTADSQVHPDYATTISNVLHGEENFNTLYSENVTNRLSNLTAMLADKAQDKTLKYLTEATTCVSTQNGAAQEVTFLPAGNSLTILQPGSPGNAVAALPSVSPGISLLVNQSAYVSINRNASSTPSIIVANNSAVPVDENIVVICSRLSDQTIYLWNGEAVIGSAPIGPASGGLTQIDLNDPVDSTLPTGSVTIDGVTVMAGMLVLFSNLGSGNNKIYMANGTGAVISGWTAQFSFNGSSSPTVADLVIVRYGTAFANQIGEFNGTTWQYSNIVRHFGAGSDVANFWEQSGLMTQTLSDATTNGTVFSVAYAGSEYQIVDYSISRGTFFETGSLKVVTDGTTVSVVEGAATLNGVSGVSFDGIISGSNLVLRYTTTATGSSATMKLSIKRWSAGPGGPSGPPSYSGGGGSGVTSLNGESGAVTLVAGSNITITPVGTNITIASTGGGGPALQGPFTVLDNQASPVTLFSYAAASNLYVVFEYSILKAGSYRVGRLLVATDGTSTTSESDDFVETGTSGVALSAVYSGGNVNIQYTSTNTGANGSLKYYMTGWV